MDIEAIFFNTATGQVVTVGLEDEGENNLGTYSVHLYSNAVNFVWGDPTKEGDVWANDTEKPLSKWGVPFLKDIKESWEELNDYEIQLLHITANAALEAEKLVVPSMCKAIYASVTQRFK